VSGPTDRIRALGDDRLLRPVLIEHAYRGIRIQLVVRVLLALFVVLAVTLVPPAIDQTTCLVVAALYILWTAGTIVWARRGGITLVRFVWIALLVDLVAIGTLTLIASRSDEQSWTADLLVNAFFLIPVLAATQLRVWVCVAVGVPTVAIYLASSAASQHANNEPWASVLLRTMALAVLATACVLISRVQRSRVLTLGSLVSDRNELIAELLTIERRERSSLAEQLHDGALQYVLAAKQDLEDARLHADEESFDRVEYALRESSTLLRSTVGQLHPVVLEQSGLVAAVRDLVQTTAARTQLAIDLETVDWDERMRTTVDAALFRAARELLTNVVKHAGASTATIELSLRAGVTQLVVEDDGTGIPPGAIEQQVGAGHIGIASLRVHIEGAGGSLFIEGRSPRGTRVRIELPARILPGNVG
jgi:two-component system, NarL family, sensor kinase